MKSATTLKYKLSVTISLLFIAFFLSESSIASTLQCINLFKTNKISFSKTPSQIVKGLELYTLQISSGRNISLKYLKATKKLPTLLLLPGVNRSLTETDPVLLQLKEAGFGIAVMDFSAQAFSIATLPKGENSHFSKNTLSLADLKYEVDTVARFLAETEKVSNLIPITLSYSGMISHLLTNYPIVVDTVPMTSADAANPTLAQFRKNLEIAQMWNPIFGPQIIRSSLDMSYRSVWEKTIDGIVEMFKLPKEKKSDMVDSYVELSRASENFNWPVKEKEDQIQRVFIVAEKEGSSLLKHQLETYLKIRESNEKTLLIVVTNSGHVLPNEKPKLFVEALKIIASIKNKGQSGVFIIDENSSKPTFLNSAEATSFIENLLNQL